MKKLSFRESFDINMKDIKSTEDYKRLYEDRVISYEELSIKFKELEDACVEKVKDLEGLLKQQRREDIVMLDSKEAVMLSEGRLVYVVHPEKGTRYVDYRRIYVNSKDLSEEDKVKFEKYDILNDILDKKVID